MDRLKCSLRKTQHPPNFPRQENGSRLERQAVRATRAARQDRRTGTMAPEFSSGFMLGRKMWHGLGDVKDTPPMSVAEIVEWMGGNDPEKVQLPTFALPNGTIVDMSNWAAIVNPDTGKVFQPAVVFDNYQVVVRQALAEICLALQELDAEEFDTLATATGRPPIVVKSAITLREGAIQAICCEIGEDMVLADGTSTTGFYLVVRNSHDGSMALGGQITMVATECMNTLLAGIRSAKSSFSIRHTKGANDRIAEAKKALGLVSKYRTSFADTARQLVDTPMSRGTFENMVKDVYPRSDGKSLAPFSEEQYALIGVLESSKTIHDSWRGSRWGGLNAVTEYETWLRKLSNTSKSEAERRLESDLWGRGAKNGDAAFQWLTKDLQAAVLTTV